MVEKRVRFEVLLEEVRSGLQTVAEGHSLLVVKIDRLEQRVGALEQRVGFLETAVLTGFRELRIRMDGFESWRALHERAHLN